MLGASLDIAEYLVLNAVAHDLQLPPFCIGRLSHGLKENLLRSRGAHLGEKEDKELPHGCVVCQKSSLEHLWSLQHDAEEHDYNVIRFQSMTGQR